jgi:hypothetical protein
MAFRLAHCSRSVRQPARQPSRCASSSRNFASQGAPHSTNDRANDPKIRTGFRRQTLARSTLRFHLSDGVCSRASPHPVGRRRTTPRLRLPKPGWRGEVKVVEVLIAAKLAGGARSGGGEGGVVASAAASFLTLSVDRAGRAGTFRSRWNIGASRPPHSCAVGHSHTAPSRRWVCASSTPSTLHANNSDQQSEQLDDKVAKYDYPATHKGTN